MPYTVEHMDTGDWSVGLQPDTPRSVLDAIDIRTRAFASIVITPLHHNTADLSVASIVGLARYVGVYLEQTDQRLNLGGSGLVWWLGEDDNGAMISTDGTFGTVDIEDLFDNNVIGTGSVFSGGLTKGTVTSTATTRQLKYESGTTRRQLLDTMCAAYDDPNYEWRVNVTGTVDVNTTATLFPTATTPTLVFTQEGGRDGAVTGLRAELDIDSIDVTDYRTNIVVDWNDGTNNGSYTNTPTSTWVDFAGATPVLRTVMDWRPKVPFREKPNKSLRANASRYAAWVINSLTQANNVAKQAAVASSSYDIEVTAEVDEYDAGRFVTAGDYVYVYDLGLDLTDTANEVYYRGSAIHPTKLRCHRVTAPIQEGMGVYLRYWDGAAFALYDLTQYVAFEEDTTTIEVGSRRRRFSTRGRPKRFNRARLRRQARHQYRLMKYLESQ